MTAPAVATCPHCRATITVRAAPSGAIRITRHTRDPRTGQSCPGTGHEVQK